jgi:hypothetical protein
MRVRRDPTPKRGEGGRITKRTNVICQYTVA